MSASGLHNSQPPIVRVRLLTQRMAASAVIQMKKWTLAVVDASRRSRLLCWQMIGDLIAAIRLMGLALRHAATLAFGLLRDACSALLNLPLRAKFLCSLIVVTAGLTCATLLVVHHTAEVHLQREIEQDARNALSTFQVLRHQHEISLSHKADLLATLAALRDEDPSVIDEPSQDPWQSEDCNLLALADANGKFIGLHTSMPGLDVPTAQNLLRRSLREHTRAAWWYDGSDLYQVVMQPIYTNGQPHVRAGTVAVGYQIDGTTVDELRETSSTHVAFRYGNDVVVSTLAPLREQEFRAEMQRDPDRSQVRLHDELFLADTVDLTPGERPGVTLTVLKPYSGAISFLSRLNHLLLGLWLIAVLAGGALVYFISDAFTRPLGRLAQGVRALESGDFAYPLEAKGGDEVAELTRSFDRMRATLLRNDAKRQELERQLRQSQRMEAMGRLAGGVAHDFNNLLTVIKGHSSLLRERLNAGDACNENNRQIEKAADRAASLTRQLLAFSRMQVLQPKVVDLNALVEDMGQMLKRLIREDITFSFDPGQSLGRVQADPSQVEQVILNLTVNACDAMPQGGRLTIETYNVDMDESASQGRPPMPPGQYVALAVTDTGVGMDAQTKARIFEPFFTTKEMGKGTGLGLATVYGVVKQSEGFIWVESEPGQGARFEVFLPRVNNAVAVSRPEKDGTGAIRRRETILIAEDEDSVRELASEFLRSAGYTVLTAENGIEAFSIAKRAGEIRLLLTDAVMPKLRGPELAKRLRQLRPEIGVIYMSGYLEYDRGNGEFLDDGFFLQKPFSRDALVKKVAEALSGRRTADTNGLVRTC
ncbi:MAG TPA: ATP-binding protein [Candidatus Acidoferrum sp.]|nr:ATP-binding protein [Candidatus Acidoferrum sp.]